MKNRFQKIVEALKGVVKTPIEGPIPTTIPEPYDGPPPEVGSVWKHKNGNIYTVTAILNEKSERLDEYPVIVAYRGVNGNLWGRPLTRWRPSMRPVQAAIPDTK